MPPPGPPPRECDPLGLPYPFQAFSNPILPPVIPPDVEKTRFASRSSRRKLPPVIRLPLAIRPSGSASSRPSSSSRPRRFRQCQLVPSAWQSRRRWPSSPSPGGAGRVTAARKPPATACASLRTRPSINGRRPIPAPSRARIGNGSPPIIPRPRRCVTRQCQVRSRRLATGPLPLPARRQDSFSLARPFNWR